METYYSSEKGIQILVKLLKAHHIKKVVTSPGGTNMMLNASLMYDGGFEMYFIGGRKIGCLYGLRNGRGEW